MELEYLDDAAEQSPERQYPALRAFAGRLSELVQTAPDGLSVFVHGEWGAGKTTALGATKDALPALRSGAPSAIWLDAWEHLHPGRALSTLVESVTRQALSVFPGDDGSDLADYVWSITRALEEGQAVGLRGLVERADVLLGPGWRDGRMALGRDASEGLFTALRRLLEGGWPDGRPVVFIDELDRCEPGLVVEVFECIRKIARRRLPIVFVVAMDRSAAERAICDSSRGGAVRCIDKVFPLSLNVPTPDGHDLEHLVEVCADRVWHPPLEAAHRAAFERAFSGAVRANPRLIKRAINRFALLLRFEAERPGLGQSATRPPQILKTATVPPELGFVGFSGAPESSWSRTPTSQPPEPKGLGLDSVEEAVIDWHTVEDDALLIGWLAAIERWPKLRERLRAPGRSHAGVEASPSALWLHTRRSRLPELVAADERLLRWGL